MAYCLRTLDIIQNSIDLHVYPPYTLVCWGAWLQPEDPEDGNVVKINAWGISLQAVDTSSTEQPRSHVATIEMADDIPVSKTLIYKPSSFLNFPWHFLHPLHGKEGKKWNQERGERER
jgi:hypothetical protein